MNAEIKFTYGTDERTVHVSLNDYDYEVTVGEVAWRFHSAMQTKKRATSYFDYDLPEWIFREKTQHTDYQISEIVMISDFDYTAHCCGKKYHDDFKGKPTPKCKRKPRRSKTETKEMELNDERS